jgi:2-polyprenyl-6-methoxyphenol hydroxylase-like FAD-dependent oxidoreductase
MHPGCISPGFARPALAPEPANRWPKRRGKRKKGSYLCVNLFPLTSSNHPILIVGAGPVGLTLALELSRRKIPVRIVEKDTGRPALSRAIGINPRTLELLEESGVTERILARGVKLKNVRLQHDGDTRTGDFTRVNHRYNFMTALPQTETERLLEEALQEQGVQVERGTAVTGFVEKEGCVWARLAGGSGGEVPASLLCGTDGAKSLVRGEAGIGFPGRDDPKSWSIADFETDTRLPAAVTLLLLKDGPLLVIPFTEGVCRVASFLPDSLDRLPTEIPVRKIVFQSQFRVSYRVAETFVRGKVVLAGDAAHVHSPIGGRGMNLGIEDACTLADVISRNGDLGAWGRIRRKKAAAVVVESRLLSSVLEAKNSLTRAARWLMFQHFERMAPFVLPRMLGV